MVSALLMNKELEAYAIIGLAGLGAILIIATSDSLNQGINNVSQGVESGAVAGTQDLADFAGLAAFAAVVLLFA